MTTNRQTSKFLRERFTDVGIRPVTRLGQNFLIDQNLLKLLAAEANLEPRDVVLEVGTGTGALTALLAVAAGSVVSVEMDAQLHLLASEELIEFENVTLLKLDVLRNKNNIQESIFEVLRQKLQQGADRRFKLVANLPYNIATPLISNFLVAPLVPDLMVVTIQKELAERMVAVPSTKDFGALSVWVQSLCDVEILRVLAPSVFWPRPKVDSAFIRVTPNPKKRADLPDLHGYHQFVRALFLHRRKFLRSVMVSTLKKQLSKPQIDELMRQLELGPDSRAEQLEVAMIQKIHSKVREYVADS